MERELYFSKQKEQLSKYEALCHRCGNCCGVRDGDPCVNLAKDSQNKYYCKNYHQRLGGQVTVSGKKFNCVPIRDLAKFDAPYPDCAYF